ncbi:hypothetical protein QEN19_001171 [Hanseniaspora menglaensis]
MKSNEYFLLESPFKRIDLDDIGSKDAAIKTAAVSNSEIITDLLQNINQYTFAYENITNTTDKILDIIYGDENTMKNLEPLVLNRVSHVNDSKHDQNDYMRIEDYRNRYSIKINDIYLSKFKDGMDPKKRLNVYIEHIYKKMENITYQDDIVLILTDLIGQIKLNDLNNDIKFINTLKRDLKLFNLLKETLIEKYFNKNKQTKKNLELDSDSEYDESIDDAYDYDDKANDRVKRLINKTQEYKKYVKQIIENNESEEDIEYLASFYKELKLLIDSEEYNVYREKFLKKYKKSETDYVYEKNTVKDSNDIVNELYFIYKTKKYNNYVNSLV